MALAGAQISFTLMYGYVRTLTYLIREHALLHFLQIFSLWSPLLGIIFHPALLWNPSICKFIDLVKCCLHSKKPQKIGPRTGLKLIFFYFSSKNIKSMWYFVASFLRYSFPLQEKILHALLLGTNFIPALLAFFAKKPSLLLY